MPVWLAAGLGSIFGGIFRSLWPKAVQAVMWLAKSRLGLVIATAFAWLGINFATVKIILEPAIDFLTDSASAGYGGGEFGAVATQWMGLLQFDRALTMIISAVVAKHAIMSGRLFLFKRGFGAKP